MPKCSGMLDPLTRVRAPKSRGAVCPSPKTTVKNICVIISRGKNLLTGTLLKKNNLGPTN